MYIHICTYSRVIMSQLHPKQQGRVSHSLTIISMVSLHLAEVHPDTGWHIKLAFREGTFFVLKVGQIGSPKLKVFCSCQKVTRRQRQKSDTVKKIKFRNIWDLDKYIYLKPCFKNFSFYLCYKNRFAAKTAQITRKWVNENIPFF